jgi:hypothetical protein
MGYEIREKSMNDLEDTLYGISDRNDRDFRTQRRALHEMYGGVNIPIYEKLFDYLRGTLGISCHSEAKELGEEEERQVVEFLSEMAG